MHQVLVVKHAQIVPCTCITVTCLCVFSYSRFHRSMFLKTKMELLNRISGDGLGVKYRFLRKPHLSSNKMLVVELTFQNTSSSMINGIGVESTQLQSGMKMYSNSTVSQVAPGGAVNTTIGVDFNDTLQPAKFNIW